MANDVLNSPGFIGAAARFWQVSSVASTVFAHELLLMRNDIALVRLRLCWPRHTDNWLYSGELSSYTSKLQKRVD
jgi:hypothetical protein